MHEGGPPAVCSLELSRDARRQVCHRSLLYLPGWGEPLAIPFGMPGDRVASLAASLLGEGMRSLLFGECMEWVLEPYTSKAALLGACCAEAKHTVSGVSLERA